MGNVASTKARERFAADRYVDYVALHGLSVEMTEALAELWHRRIREEWGFADEDGPTLTGLFRQKYRGGRYSWGYPACPDLEDNAKVVELLGGGQIGVSVSEGFQLEPEQTTLAYDSPPPPGRSTSSPDSVRYRNPANRLLGVRLRPEKSGFVGSCFLLLRGVARTVSPSPECRPALSPPR